ncbi:hypothetical protein WG66_006155 [Moniliophthora roreri]|nr:hypothetical protein WG66_006155 [Moniliophthora roreri]
MNPWRKISGERRGWCGSGGNIVNFTVRQFLHSVCKSGNLQEIKRSGPAGSHEKLHKPIATKLHQTGARHPGFNNSSEDVVRRSDMAEDWRAWMRATAINTSIASRIGVGREGMILNPFTQPRNLVSLHTSRATSNFKNAKRYAVSCHTIQPEARISTRKRNSPERHGTHTLEGGIIE